MLIFCVPYLLSPTIYFRFLNKLQNDLEWSIKSPYFVHVLQLLIVILSYLNKSNWHTNFSSQFSSRIFLHSIYFLVISFLYWNLVQFYKKRPSTVSIDQVSHTFLLFPVHFLHTSYTRNSLSWLISSRHFIDGGVPFPLFHSKLRSLNVTQLPSTYVNLIFIPYFIWF